MNKNSYFLSGLLAICFVANSFGMQATQPETVHLPENLGPVPVLQILHSYSQTPSSGLRGFVQSGFNSLSKKRETGTQAGRG